MISRGSTLAAAGFAAAAILAPLVAEADTSSTVVLVGDTADPFVARMRAELASMGFDVRLQGELTGEPPRGTLAVARLEPGPSRRLEVIVVATDASLRVPSRTAVIDAPEGADDQGVASVRAAEQLRAFFQPLRPPSPPETVDVASVPVPAPSPEPVRRAPEPPRSPRPPLPAAPPPAAPPPAAAREARSQDMPLASVALGLGPGMDVGGVGLDGALTGRLRVHRHVALGAVLVGPLVPTSVEGPEGKASLRALVTGVDVAWVLSLASDALRVEPSVGFAVATMISEGEATPPYASQSDVGSAALPFGRLELTPRLVGPLRASVQGMVGVAVTDLGVRFGGRQVATWGRPWGSAFLGVSLDL